MTADVTNRGWPGKEPGGEGLAMPGVQTMEALASKKPQFLGFLRAHLGDERLAEDMLQADYLRAAEKAGTIRSDESMVAWFYQLLRNALIDLHRARARRPDAPPLDEVDDASLGVPPEQLREAVCRCLEAVIDTLSQKARVLPSTGPFGEPLTTRPRSRCCSP